MNNEVKEEQKLKRTHEYTLEEVDPEEIKQREKELRRKSRKNKKLIKRENLKIELWETWTKVDTMKMTNKTYFIEVEKGSQEWKDVEKAMNVKVWDKLKSSVHWDEDWFKSKNSLVIQKLERIQNQYFWEKYSRKLNEIREFYQKDKYQDYLQQLEDNDHPLYVYFFIFEIRKLFVF